MADISFSSTPLPVLHSTVVRDCNWNQPEPVHMHWKVHSRLISSSGPHEDDPCAHPGVHPLRKRRPERSCRIWYDPGHCGYDLVQSCVLEAWRQRMPRLQGAGAGPPGRHRTGRSTTTGET